MSGLRRLAVPDGVTAGHRLGGDFGAVPRLQWLPVVSLGLDDAFQRPLTKRGIQTITEIVETFSWSKFSPVICCPVGRDGWSIIDGQHRCLAALRLGIDEVPCYVVEAVRHEAAAIFSAVNGTVTPMTALAVYKGALAAGEDWAVRIRACCDKAGVEALTYPKAQSQMKPRQTIAIGRLRGLLRRHGDDLLTAVLVAAASSRDAVKPGHVNSALLARLAAVLNTRPGWVREREALARAVSTMMIGLMDHFELERQIEKAMGDGRSTAEADAELRGRVADLRGRKFSTQMIATTLRIPYRLVEQLSGETAP